MLGHHRGDLVENVLLIAHMFFSVVVMVVVVLVVVLCSAVSGCPTPRMTRTMGVVGCGWREAKRSVASRRSCTTSSRNGTTIRIFPPVVEAQERAGRS